MSVSSELHAAIDARFPDLSAATVVLIYALNLDVGLPPALVLNLSQLSDRFAQRPGRRIFTLAIAPEAALAAIADRSVSFGAIEDGSFRQRILDELTGGIWPFQRQVHDGEAAIPLLPQTERGRFGLFRICQTDALMAQPIGTRVVGETFAPLDGIPAVKIPVPGGPLLPVSEFVPATVTVPWRGCSRYCDHLESAQDISGWTVSQRCTVGS